MKKYNAENLFPQNDLRISPKQYGEILDNLGLKPKDYSLMLRLHHEGQLPEWTEHRRDYLTLMGKYYDNNSLVECKGGYFRLTQEGIDFIGITEIGKTLYARAEMKARDEVYERQLREV